jgi:formylglycine-generating enzyme required for sulfatase activity
MKRPSSPHLQASGVAAVALGLACGFFTASGLCAADGITNVVATQRPGTALVDISYDLGTTNTNGLFVAVAVSTNGGLSYTLPAAHFSGDVGFGVMAGTNKLIVWDAVRDWPDQFSTKVFFRLTTSDVPPGMVLVPAGPFVMGDTFGEGYSDELPLHTNQISAFYMDRYEVTKALWDEVRLWANTNGYDLGTRGSGKSPNHPVQSVNWYDCVKWCNARSEKEGRVPAYYTSAAQTTVYRTGQVNVENDWVKWNAGYRLPTEAEWEKAARGGTPGHRFPWSDSDTIQHSRANYYSSSSYAYDTSPTREYHPTFDDGVYPYTSPVGYFAPSGYGLYDMAGNVWEWCWDRYGSCTALPATDPRGPASGSDRVIRGGGWGSHAVDCRTAYRDNFVWPGNREGNRGFRSVLSPGQPCGGRTERGASAESPEPGDDARTEEKGEPRAAVAIFLGKKGPWGPREAA